MYNHNIAIYHTHPQLNDNALACLQFLTAHNYSVCVQFLSDKANQKWLKAQEFALLCDDNTLWLIIDGMKVSPNWHSLQKRITHAGKNSEHLLKACKLNHTMTAIDGTAGFGHDGLILASTGAKVIMIEQNPLIYVLLQFELTKMAQNPNWHKLLDRVSLYFGQACDVLPNLNKADLVYLDPMFPKDSFKAKVAKPMQMLHKLLTPPTPTDEITLLNCAKQALTTTGKVVVKRPKLAPFLANACPNYSFDYDGIRFDEYKISSPMLLQ